MNALVQHGFPLAEQDAELVAVARDTLAVHGRSFALAGKLLSRTQRNEAAVVYAFCRLVDDTADEAPSHAIAIEGLTQLDAEIACRVPARPLVAAFLQICATRQIPAAAGRELLRGVRTDLAGYERGHGEPLLVADDRELLRYAYRVAGTVGLMMCGVTGVSDRSAWPQAIDLGVAMQLTNIARDVAEDARRGRVYLPADRLARHGVTSNDLLAPGAADNPVVRAATQAVVRELLELAETYYASAHAALAAIPWRARFAIGAAARIYRAIGQRLLRTHDADPWHGRTVVPMGRRLLALVRGVAFVALRSARARRPHDPRLHAPLQGLPGCATHESRYTDR